MRPRTCSSPSALALACAVCACGAWLLPRPAAAILSWEEHLEEVNRPRPQRLRRFLENVLVRTGAPRQVPPPPLNDAILHPDAFLELDGVPAPELDDPHRMWYRWQDSKNATYEVDVFFDANAAILGFQFDVMDGTNDTGYPYNVTILGAHGGEAGTYLNALIPLGDDKEKQSLRAAGNMTAAIPANPRTHRHRDYWRHLLTLTVQSRALDRHEIEEVCLEGLRFIGYHDPNDRTLGFNEEYHEYDPRMLAQSREMLESHAEPCHSHDHHEANKARERQRQLDEAQQRVADKREEFRAQREGKLAMADARDGEL